LARFLYLLLASASATGNPEQRRTAEAERRNQFRPDARRSARRV